MLRPSLTLAFALCILTSPLLAQEKDQLYTATHQQLDVTKVLLAQEAAWNKGDLDAYLSHYKDDPTTQAILSFPVRGLDKIRAAYHVNYPNSLSMGTLEQSEVEVRGLGENFALATGKYHLMRSKKKGGDVDGSFTEIFEKTAEGWQVIFSETI
jgi:uncharacterized protein (TIGR02246 family)